MSSINDSFTSSAETFVVGYLHLALKEMLNLH